MAKAQEFVETLIGRLEMISELFNSDELIYSYDVLRKKKKTDMELLYFHNGVEKRGLFIFGSEYYQKELSEQEFKKILGQNAKNFKIFRAFKMAQKKIKKVKVSDVLNEIQDEKKDSKDIDAYLGRILTLAYYLNWDLKKVSGDIEGDYYISIPDSFITRLKQRFSFDNLVALYENQDIFIFLNNRGKLNCVFKEKDNFTREDVETKVAVALKKVFSLKKVVLKQ